MKTKPAQKLIKSILNLKEEIISDKNQLKTALND